MLDDDCWMVHSLLGEYEYGISVRLIDVTKRDIYSLKYNRWKPACHLVPYKNILKVLVTETSYKNITLFWTPYTSFNKYRPLFLSSELL